MHKGSEPKIRLELSAKEKLRLMQIKMRNLKKPSIKKDPKKPAAGVIRFEYDVPLEKTMVFESEYHENLQYDLVEKRELKNTAGAFFVWMFVGTDLVGESYGLPISGLEEMIEGLSELPEGEKEKGIYCYSNTILASFQRQGFGKILKAHWLGLAAARGFRFVYGHARPGGSQALNVRFGATLLSSFTNWYETGEDYQLYRLVLDRMDPHLVLR